MMHDNESVIYDLDGTICKYNTFHMYIIFLFILFLFSLNFMASYKLLSCVYQRVTRRISHYKFKGDILLLVSNLNSKCSYFFAKFITIISRSRFTKLRKIVGDKNYYSVLATAAPFSYAVYLKDLLGFDHVIASEINSGFLTENIREIKCKRVMSYLYDMNLKPYALFTDHHDDIFISNHVKLIYLVDPSMKTIDIFNEQRFEYIIVNDFWGMK